MHLAGIPGVQAPSSRIPNLQTHWPCTPSAGKERGHDGGGWAVGVY